MFTRVSAGRVVLVALTFVSTFAIRVRGVSTQFWLLEDQIRDWSIALRPFADLPLVGPPTHVHGYTIGPAFYWILWAIRVTLGPWFDNLPHAGGIGHVVLHSAADALLLVALWKRTGSPWVAFGAVFFVATAAYDLCLAPLIWNPVMGTILAKTAVALVLLNWSRGSLSRIAVITAIAWCAVQVYTGAVFVAVGVFLALLAEPMSRRDWISARRTFAVLCIVVAVLQVPYVVHQVQHRFSDSAMGAVTGSVSEILAGRARPEIAKSLNGFVGAFRFIEFAPYRAPFAGWLLLAGAMVFAVRHRHDPSLLTLILLPQLAAIAGYALFLASVDSYYYLSLMPIEVLMIVLACTPASRPAARGTPAREAADPADCARLRKPTALRLAGQVAGVAFVAGVLMVAPSRIRLASTMHKMPEYRVLVDASRHIRNRHQAMRAIQTDFPLPPTANPSFLYEVLGGRLDRASPWVAIIGRDANVRYVRVPN